MLGTFLSTESHFVQRSAYPFAVTIAAVLISLFHLLQIVTQLFVNPFVDEEGVRYVPVRPRPPITLLRHYRNPWKAAYHHFQRYSDVRVKGQCAACTRALRHTDGV